MHPQPKHTWTQRTAVRVGLALALSGGCFTACRKEAGAPASPALDPNVIACVQGTAIRETSFRQKLKERLGRTAASTSPVQPEAVLEEMIRQEAVYAQLKAARFDERPEVAALIKNLLVNRFIEQELGAEGPGVTSDEIQRYYANHTGEFLNPEAVRGALIFVRASTKMTPEKREELKQRAQLVLAEARTNSGEADFIRLAQRHSEDQATRHRGGDLGWLTRPQAEAALGPALSAALFVPGQARSIAPLLETADGFYVLKVQERREAQARPLPEVEALIRYRLMREHQFQRQEDFYARMKQGLEVQINRPLLESISVPPIDQPPPALPDSRGAQRITSR